MNHLEHLLNSSAEVKPAETRINLDAMRIALAVPEALNACEAMASHFSAFLEGKVIAQGAYEELIEKMELTARTLISRAETLRNGQKPKVCVTCKK